MVDRWWLYWFVPAIGGLACGPDSGTGATSSSGSSTTAIVTTGVPTTGDVTAVTSPTTGGDAPTLGLEFEQTKQFMFSWPSVPGVEHYRLLERVQPDDEFSQLGADIVDTAVARTMPLHLRFGASYILRACTGDTCTDSAPLDVVDSMAGAVGYFKASSAAADDHFGETVEISADGQTLVVGAPGESDPGDDLASGAVHVFTQTAGEWTEQANLKVEGSSFALFGVSLALSADGSILAVGAQGVDVDAGAVYMFRREGAVWPLQAELAGANTESGDAFGNSVALSAAGDVLAVGACAEASPATGVDGDGSNDAASGVGAVYVFTQIDGAWTQQAYLKPSHPGTGGETSGENFGGPRSEGGGGVALSADGRTLAVGSPGEDSAAQTIDGDQTDDSAPGSGAAYVFVQAAGVWSQQAYIKPSDGQAGANFGFCVRLAQDGDTLAVGAPSAGSGAAYVFSRTDDAWSEQARLQVATLDDEDQFGAGLAVSGAGDLVAVGAYRDAGASPGVGGDPQDDSAYRAGAVHVFARGAGDWPVRAYVKASNARAGQFFGRRVALSSDGDILAAGAFGESSAAQGINGDQTDVSASQSGAVYVY